MVDRGAKNKSIGKVSVISQKRYKGIVILVVSMNRKKEDIGYLLMPMRNGKEKN